MSEPLSCPRCAAILTDSEVRSLHKRYASAQRKTRSGGKNGGRKKLTPEQVREAGIAIPWKVRSDPRFDPAYNAVAQPHPKPEAEAPGREHSIPGTVSGTLHTPTRLELLLGTGKLVPDNAVLREHRTVLVNPITQQPTDCDAPPHVPRITEGQYQNVHELTYEPMEGE